jgi:hypothetical protein
MQCSKPRRYSTTSSGAREQCRWNFEAKRHRRGQVEYEFKPGWLLNRHLVAAHVSAAKMCSRKLHSKRAGLLRGPYDFRGGSLDLQRVTFRP